MEGERRTEFVKASFVDPQTRGEPSFYEFETSHKHSIVLYYYLAFSVAECLPLLILARMFSDVPDRTARTWRYFLYAGAPLFLLWGEEQPLKTLQGLWRDRRTRPNMGAYTAALATALAATALLLRHHSIANVLLAVRGKFVFSVGLRVLKRFPLKGREVRFCVLLGCYMICLALAGHQAFFTLMLAEGGGLVFFLAETLFARGITVVESEVLFSASNLVLAFLCLMSAVVRGDDFLRATPLEAIWAWVVAGSSFCRFWVLKRLKRVQNDSTAEAYNEVLIVFVGITGFALSFFFGRERRWAAESFAALLGLTAFLTFREKELRALFGALKDHRPAESEENLMA